MAKSSLIRFQKCDSLKFGHKYEKHMFLKDDDRNSQWLKVKYDLSVQDSEYTIYTNDWNPKYANKHVRLENSNNIPLLNEWIESGITNNYKECSVVFGVNTWSQIKDSVIDISSDSNPKTKVEIKFDHYIPIHLPFLKLAIDNYKGYTWRCGPHVHITEEDFENYDFKGIVALLKHIDAYTFHFFCYDPFSTIRLLFTFGHSSYKRFQRVIHIDIPTINNPQKVQNMENVLLDALNRIYVGEQQKEFIKYYHFVFRIEGMIDSDKKILNNMYRNSGNISFEFPKLEANISE